MVNREPDRVRWQAAARKGLRALPALFVNYIITKQAA
jgi:hypothetical protein